MPNVGQEPHQPSQHQTSLRDLNLDNIIDELERARPSENRKDIVVRVFHAMLQDLLKMDVDLSEMRIRRRDSKIVNQDEEEGRTILDINVEMQSPPKYSDISLEELSLNPTAGNPPFYTNTGGCGTSFGPSPGDQHQYATQHYQNQSLNNNVDVQIGTDLSSLTNPFVAGSMDPFTGNPLQYGVTRQTLDTPALPAGPRYPSVGTGDFGQYDTQVTLILNFPMTVDAS